MAVTYLSIGSNTGNREMNISQSLDLVGKNVGPVIAASRVYETQSWGYQGENFLNLAIKVETCLEPTALLEQIRNIEHALGRKRSAGEYTDRNIDLDILFYGYEIIHLKELLIPHPFLQNRLFVLYPMIDLDPEFVHPILKKTMAQLRDECTDKGWIRVYKKD